MKKQVTTICICLLILAGSVHANQAEAPLSGLKIIAVWSVDATADGQVDSAVEQARSLGFNAVCWNTPLVCPACHKRDMKAFAIVCPLEKRPASRLQEIRTSERNLPGCDPDKIGPAEFYQYGGEPADGNHEILDQNLTCPNDPGVVQYTMEQIIASREAGYDGIVFDFVGYRNYHSCECEICTKKIREFSNKQTGISAAQINKMYFGKVLVELYDTLYAAAKAVAPEMIVANHIHPVFRPETMYGLNVNTDYCGITVSWFFKPHWPLEKVEKYTKNTVCGPYRHKHARGMPMIGFYSDGAYERDRKSGSRLKQEFEILKQVNAQHLLMCELGHILRNPEAADIVRAALTGNKEKE
jgi:hypothetical protein